MSKLAKSNSSFETQFQQLFNTFFYPDRHSLTKGSWSPACDIVEDKDNGTTTISIDVPGMSLSDISVTVDNKILTVTGERKKVIRSDNNYSKSEVVYGKFMRNFTLPSNLDCEGISAKYKDGVLSLEIKHLGDDSTKPKQIPISS